MRWFECRTWMWILILGVTGEREGMSMENRDPWPKEGRSRDWLLDSSAYRARVDPYDKDKGLILSNGLISRTFLWEPNCATVAFDNLMTGMSILRAVKPEATVVLNGVPFHVGGLHGQPNHAYLLPEWLEELEAGDRDMVFVGFEVGQIEPRMQWSRVRHHAPKAKWPPAGISLRMDYEMPETADFPEFRGIKVSVYYELYDGMPCLSKWLVILNEAQDAVLLDRFTSEILAAVEYGSAPEAAGGSFQTPNLHVETDHSMGGMTSGLTSHFSFRWVPDPDYHTQVDYPRANPCLLEVSPSLGPHQILNPGESFETFRVFLLVWDSYDRERNGLAQRRMYRTLAPWVTENPLMMHVRYADPTTVKNAIDQCSIVGFEMVILTFGSGFDAEDERPQTLDRMKDYARYAKERGVEIGGYSLLASRSVGGGHDVVMPEGMSPTFGNSPCLGSAWGQEYFRKLYRFFETTGFRLLEHDGSYPGDVCASRDHPGHDGLEDSRWKQWRMITDFYAWCRGQGIYLNVPDYYYLAGSNKSGMGYREVNWSLPRDQQVVHTRQNIFDGTWQKTPSMGWMFVPLTEYHGGGEAATIEPLDVHLDHYERMLYSNLALGVQACYRGPRLFDTDRTREMVKRWVDWFKKYRDILESDLIHGRRADGRDLDWMLHVNPDLEEKAMLIVFNPTGQTLQKTLSIPLYYAGFTDRARMRPKGGKSKTVVLDREFKVDVKVKVKPKSMTWTLFMD